LLAELEVGSGRPIGRSFELVAGTSIGGIIALAIGFEIPMHRVVDVFTEFGPELFPKRRRAALLGRFRDYFREAYDQRVLRSVIEALLGPDALLGHSKHPLLIPAVNVTQGRPQVFKTRHHENFDRDWRLSAIDVGLATSAAPTLFRPAIVNQSLCVDGGLFANSPSLMAIHEATYFLRQPLDSLWLLSVGTTTTQYSVVDDHSHCWGIKYWLADSERRLLNVMLSAQQQYSEQISAHMLEKRYLRMESIPSHEQAMQLGLDVATPAAIDVLMGLGRKAGSDARGSPGVREILTHDARDWLLPMRT
jgi:patatin-like phospholipase/acyl hydrolase